MAMGVLIGTAETTDFRECDVQMAQQEIAKEFKIPLPSSAGYWGDLFRALADLSGDPDIDIADWVDHGFPLGIDRPIVPRGVFPHVADDSDAINMSKTFDTMMATSELHAHRNYKSYYDEAEAADQDLERIVNMNFAEKMNASELEAKFGKEMRIPKVAVIAKEKADGSNNIRLIVGMLRSGTNGFIKIRERLVLPRMTDLAEATVDILENGEDTKHAEFFAFDFKDAFYTEDRGDGAAPRGGERIQRFLRLPLCCIRARLGPAPLGPVGRSYGQILPGDVRASGVPGPDVCRRPRRRRPR